MGRKNRLSRLGHKSRRQALAGLHKGNISLRGRGQRIHKNDPEIVLGDDQSGWITDIVYTDSGSGVVKSLKVGGKSFTGNSFRALFR